MLSTRQRSPARITISPTVGITVMRPTIFGCLILSRFSIVKVVAAAREHCSKRIALITVMCGIKYSFMIPLSGSARRIPEKQIPPVFNPLYTTQDNFIANAEPNFRSIWRHYDASIDGFMVCYLLGRMHSSISVITRFRSKRLKNFKMLSCHLVSFGLRS